VRTRSLGAEGPEVSVVGLGTNNFGARIDYDQSKAVLDEAIEQGVTLVDTADIYSQGTSEEFIGRALEGRRDAVFVATKFGKPMNESPSESRGSPEYVRWAVEGSLRRLRTDFVDVYQMHEPDPSTPVEETLGVLDELVREGKVRFIGSSTFPAELIVGAQWAAEQGGHHRFRSEQPRYSILTRIIEGHVLPTAQRYGMGVLTYGPLSSGWLSGRADPTRGHRVATAPQAFDLAIPANQVRQEAVRQLTKLAADAGLPLTHLATAFVRSHPVVTSVLIGPRTPGQLDDLLAGADVELSEDVLDRIDEIVPPGTEINPADNYLAAPPALGDKRLRRR
jgi:aryl-alcohol dehydrogenase-like predicted oxidoreductase